MKILIIRFSSIGDIVLTSPIIRCIKQQLKNVQVHYITKKQFATILESNPFIDKLYTIESRVLGTKVSALLKKENYDFVVDLHNNLRSAHVKAVLGKKSKSFYKLNIEKWLMTNFKMNKLPNIHIVDRYFETVKSLGVVNDGKGLDYFIPERDNIESESLPVEFQNASPTEQSFGRGYIGFVIGAKYFTKQLPKEKIVSIIQKLNQPVVLLGGKEDYEKGEQIQAAINSGGRQTAILNACGKYNLNQSAVLVKKAKKIITHDTGLMHIAAAFKKEIVSIWGNTIPEFGMYPYYGKFDVKNLKVEVKNLSCRPCSKLGFEKCPKKHFKCMNEINEEAIIQFVNE